MKAIAAVLFLALLACADARTILKKSVAKASSVAIAGDDSYSSADSHAKASDGSLALSDATAIALEGSIAKAKADADADDGSTATADALALATDWSFADADAEAKADYWSDADADAVAIATNDGSAKSTADAIAVYEADADAKSKAVADGGEAKATSKAVANNADATSVAKAESEEAHHYYYPKCYDDGCKDAEGYHLPSYYYGYKQPAGADIEKHLYPYYYDPFYYKYAHYTNTYSYYHPAIEGGAEAAVKYHGYYIPHPKVEDDAVEVKTLKYYDPTLIEYYSHKVYDFGCYEGKFYRSTYDDSCGQCPYGHFCGSVKKNVCKDVAEWVECEEKDVPVCLPYDVPTYKTLFTACGPSYCHPGYKCEAFEHKTCAPKVIVKVDPAVEIKAVHQKYVGLYADDDGKDCGDDCGHYVIPHYEHDDDDCDDDDCHHYVIPHYEHDDDGCDDDDCHDYVIPHYEHDDDGCDDDDCHGYIPFLHEKSSAKATATAVSTSHAIGEESYTNVDLSASGGGSAYGNAEASTENTSAYSKGKANEDVGAKIWTGSNAFDGGKAVATGKATYEEDD